MPRDTRPRYGRTPVPLWAPGEWLAGDAVLVTDAATDERLVVSTGHRGAFEIPLAHGRSLMVAGARGELIDTEGDFALCRLADGRTVYVRIVAGWQLAAEGTRPILPDPQEADR